MALAEMSAKASLVVVFADECTDASNIRWVDELLQDNENVIGVYNVGTIDAKTLTDALEDVLLRAGLKIHNCRGQCYDGVLQICLDQKLVSNHTFCKESHGLCSPIVMGNPSTLLLVMHLKTIKCVGMPWMWPLK